MTEQELREKALDDARGVLSDVLYPGPETLEPAREIVADALLRWRAEGEVAGREVGAEVAENTIAYLRSPLPSVQTCQVNCRRHPSAGREGRMSDQPDRLEEIKEDLQHYRTPSYNMLWLISEVERLRRPEPCDVCTRKPLPNGRECICGGAGTASEEKVGLRKEVFRLDAENERLRKENAELKEDRDAERTGKRRVGW